MLTDEEWYKEFHNLGGSSLRYPHEIGTIKRIRAEAIKHGLTLAAEAIAKGCPMCGGLGYIVVTESGHNCNGDEDSCSRNCPVPIEAQQQCEHCAILAAHINRMTSLLRSYQTN